MNKCFKRKGALFIEYALILAFIASVGAFFITNNTIKDSTISIFAEIDNLFGEKQPEQDTLYKTLKRYAAVFTSDSMFHDKSMSTIKTNNGRDLPLGKEWVSGYIEPNFGDQLRANGIYEAYIGSNGTDTYKPLLANYNNDKVAYQSELDSYLAEHYLPSTNCVEMLTLSTDGNSTWEVGKSYNAVQYMSYKAQVNKKDAQIVASYRTVTVNVISQDKSGKFKYTYTVDGNTYSNNDVGGGWQEFKG